MTDTDALTERIARVLHEVDPITGHGHNWGKLTNAERRFYSHKAAAVLPILRAAQADAWDEGCTAGDVSAYHGNPTPPNPYRETGDQR